MARVRRTTIGIGVVASAAAVGVGVLVASGSTAHSSPVSHHRIDVRHDHHHDAVDHVRPRRAVELGAPRTTEPDAHTTTTTTAPQSTSGSASTVSGQS